MSGRIPTCNCGKCKKCHFRIWQRKYRKGFRIRMPYSAKKREKLMFLPIKSMEQIQREIEALKPLAKDYDTANESTGSRVAAGAHDALRWVLGMAENSVSESLKEE